MSLEITVVLSLLEIFFESFKTLYYHLVIENFRKAQRSNYAKIASVSWKPSFPRNGLECYSNFLKDLGPILAIMQCEETLVYPCFPLIFKEISFLDKVCDRLGYRPKSPFGIEFGRPELFNHYQKAVSFLVLA